MYLRLIYMTRRNKNRTYLTGSFLIDYRPEQIRKGVRSNVPGKIDLSHATVAWEYLNNDRKEMGINDFEPVWIQLYVRRKTKETSSLNALIANKGKNND